MLTSPLWVGGEIFVGFSLPIFVGVLIAAFDDKIRMRGYEQSEAAPRRLPSTGVFQLPALDAPQLGHSRIVARAKLGRSEAALAPHLCPRTRGSRRPKRGSTSRDQPEGGLSRSKMFARGSPAPKTAAPTSSRCS